MKQVNNRQCSISSPYPDTLDTTHYPVLERALSESNGLLVPDTFKEGLWKSITPGIAVRSWLGIPLCSSNYVIGLLCASHSSPNDFAADHLRMARSLAIPAAVAVQNARLYERTEIYAAELKKQLRDPN